MRASSIRAAPLLLAAAVAHADGPVTTTPTVIVSATRTAQTVDETLAPVSVVTREDIERLQANSVQDVLRGLPGVSFANNGGPGKATSLFLRGAESDQVLVLIDGLKVGSATLGAFRFQDLPVEQIERIEVVRGPRASLYGSEAIGGVVQIFTRKGGGRVKPFARATAGSRHTFDSSAGIQGGGDRAWFNASGTVFTTRGIDACRGVLTAGCFADEPDRDGYRNRSVALRAGVRPTATSEVEGHVLATSGHNESDGGIFTGNRSDVRERVLGAKVSLAPLEPWQLTLRGGRSREEADNDKDGVFVSEFISRRDTFVVQNDVQVGDAHLLTAGFDWQRDQVDGSTPYPTRSRWNKGLFGQLQGFYGAHDVLVAYRHDDNQAFGSANTGSAAWGWRFHPSVRMVASYGTAFKAPTFNELYFPFFGDPTLDPEESRTWELRFEGRTTAARWSVGAFRSRVTDLIGFDPQTFTAVNVGKARIRGIEATLLTTLAGVDVDASYTLLDPRNRESGANFDKLLPRRPEQVLRLDLDRRVGPLRVGATILAESERFDDPGNLRRLGGYVVVDLRAEYALAPSWTLQARVENLLDKSYETAAFFNQPGRGAFVTLRYAP
jgi:vitamin B12 transporter